MVKKIYVANSGVVTDITSTFNDIERAMVDIDLNDFSKELQMKHFEFLERLKGVNLKNYKELASFVTEAQKSIDEAERNATLKGEFRETNLDWAYLKRKDVREYAESMLQAAQETNVKNFCSTAVRKMKR